MTQSNTPPFKPATCDVHGGLKDETQYGSLMTPLYLTSTFVLEGVGQ